MLKSAILARKPLAPMKPRTTNAPESATKNARLPLEIALPPEFRIWDKRYKKVKKGTIAATKK
jgi:hypothetical protein